MCLPVKPRSSTPCFASSESLHERTTAGVNYFRIATVAPKGRSRLALRIGFSPEGSSSGLGSGLHLRTCILARPHPSQRESPGTISSFAKSGQVQEKWFDIELPDEALLDAQNTKLVVVVPTTGRGEPLSTRHVKGEVG
jgi:hypothetical protein